MKQQELERLQFLEKRIREIAEEFGLLTTDIIFEIVPAQRVLEGMAYGFPINFSHWSFGRDYERWRTVYEHFGVGIPYEQVWNFETPKAFIVETNPFALKVLTIAHVFGHVDFFLRNRYLKHGRSFSNLAEEARNAAERFASYEERYGKEEVEKIIDAALSIADHQHPDPFFEEQDEEVVRERLIAIERAKLERGRDVKSEFAKPLDAREVTEIERRLKMLSVKTPPEPVYDILRYITKKSPLPLKPWMEDVLTIVRNQARALAPNRRTKMLNEGWATYWHVLIMRRLFEEGLLSPEEHDTFNYFHSGVTAENRKRFSWYRVGLALFGYVKERWDKGQFGRDYEESTDPFKRSTWDTKALQGTAKIFEVAENYTDRMAVEHFFTDEFIREQRLYIFEEETEKQTGIITEVIVENDPEVIRDFLKTLFTFYGIPIIRVEDGNFRGHRELYLVHESTGYELDEAYTSATLMKIHTLWGRNISLETRVKDKFVVFTCNGKEIKLKEK